MAYSVTGVGQLEAYRRLLEQQKYEADQRYYSQQVTTAVPPTPAPPANPLERVSDADLVMEMLTRGFIVQKAPAE